VAVLAMIGGFFIVAVLVGVLARLYTPDLLSTGETDAAVLLVPSAALGQGWTAWLLGGLVAAGTAAAFLSTSSGLVVSLAGVLFTDVLRGRWKDFRLAAVCSALLPIALALTVQRLDFAFTVPLSSPWRPPRSACWCWASGRGAQPAARPKRAGGWGLSTFAVLQTFARPATTCSACSTGLRSPVQPRSDDGAGQPHDPQQVPADVDTVLRPALPDARPRRIGSGL
jgi:hypothetical protein